MGSRNDSVAAIDTALSGGELEVDSLEYITLGLSNEELSELRNALLPRLLRLVEERPLEAAKIPLSTVNALFRDVPVSKLPYNALDLHNHILRPIVVEQLSRVTPTDLEDSVISAKIKEAISFVLDPDTPAQPWDDLVRRLAELDQLGNYLPYQELYNGPAELQGRLMEANLARPESIPLNYAVWPLECPEDPLLAHLRLNYTTQLAKAVPNSPALLPVYDEGAKIYSSSDQPNPDLAKLLSLAPLPLFLELDSCYSLAARCDPNLLSRIDPGYLIQTHPMLLGRLELSQSNLPVFVNLVQNPIILGLLNLPAASVRRLPIESQAQLLFSASTNADAARVFMQAFPTVAGEVLKRDAAFGADFLRLQRDIRENLKRQGLLTVSDPLVTVGSTFS